MINEYFRPLIVNYRSYRGQDVELISGPYLPRWRPWRNFLVMASEQPDNQRIRFSGCGGLPIFTSPESRQVKKKEFFSLVDAPN